MRQSNVIAGALLGGFIIFITVRGELPEYIALFTRKKVDEQTTDKKKGSFFGFDIPFLSKNTEKNAEDTAIDAIGTKLLGPVWTTGDKYI